MAVYLKNAAGRIVDVDPRRVDALLTPGFTRAVPPAPPAARLSIESEGGGWYQIMLGDTELERVRGKRAAEKRLTELADDGR